MAKVSALASGGGREGGRMEPLAAGEIVDERFEIIAPLGRGGGGAVYEVQDRRAGTPLALKMLAPKLARGRSLVHFVREYRVASRIKDARFVRAYDFGTFSNTYYFTMDLVRGGSLSAQAKGITLPPGVAVGLVLQLLSSLDSLHHLNITHRDIKPLNLLLDGPLPTTEGARGNHGSPLPILPTVRLTDFGIARVGDLNDESVLGQATGTPRYMAPEVLSRGVADPRVDLFATGVVLYELLTGHHPLSGTGNTRSVVEEFLTGEQEVEPAKKVPEQLCPTLADLLGRLLSRDPLERPRTAALVHDELWRWWQEARPPFQLPEQPPLRGSPYLASGPLVGREEELDRVEHFFVRLFDSQALSQQENLSARERRELLCPSVMVVSGVPGVGKSRLTWQILRMAQSLGAKALVGQCKQETEQAYEGLSGVLKLLSERDVLSETSSQSSSVSSGIRSLECELKEEQTAIEAVEEDQTRPALGAAKPLEPTPALPSWQRIPSIHDREYELLRREAADGVEAIRQHELRQRFFFEQTAALLLRWGVHHKTLIAVEDVQWADPSTGSLLAFLLRAVAIARGEGYPGKIAFCLTHRPAADDNAVHRLESMLENQAHLEQEPLRLELKPFPSEHSAELTAALLMEPLGPEVQLFSRALFRDLAATPLFVEQVLRILLYQGQLTLGRSDDQGRWSGQWNLDPTVAAQSQLPATVQEAIGERATRLSVQTQRLLALASVEGRQFTVAILARITELHENEVLDSLDEAAQEGFVQAVLETRGTTVAYGSSRHYRFVHDRYREALYERLDTEARRDIHLQLAKAITHLLGEGTETAEALGWHYACGGDHARAHTFNVTAADAALSTGAFERAAELYGAAFAAAERGGLAVDPALHGRYADACVATGAFDTAQYHYEQRIASLAPGLERWDTQRRAAELNYRRRDLKNATAPLEALLREMGHPAPRTDLGYTLGLVLGAWRPALLVLLAVLRHHFKGRRCRDPVRMTVLTRAWYMLTECYAFVDFRRSIYHATQGYGLRTFWESDFGFRPALMGSIAYGSTSLGFTMGGRAIREWTAELLQQPTDADSAAVGYVLLLHAWYFSGQSRLDLVAPALQNAEASGDIQRRFMSRLLAWVVLHFSGRQSAAQAVGKSIAKLGERYNLEGLEAWSMYLEAADHQLAGRTSTAHQLFSQAQTVLERHGDILGSLSSHVQRVLSEALLSASSPEVPHDAIFREALELTKTLLARRLNGTNLYSQSLAAAACALWAHPRATHAQWRELEKVHRQARRPCLAMRNETPLYLAVGAMIAAQKVQTKKAQKLLTKSLSLAKLYQNAEGLVLACRLAGMLYPPDSPEHRSYADREARFLAKMEALPAPSFDQILEGHVGPGPWDTP